MLHAYFSPLLLRSICNNFCHSSREQIPCPANAAPIRSLHYFTPKVAHIPLRKYNHFQRGEPSPSAGFCRYLKLLRNMDPSSEPSDSAEPPLGWSLSPNPMVNLIIGLAAIASALYFFSFNEKRAIVAIIALSDGVYGAESVPDSFIFPEYEGKLVHVQGKVDGVGPVEDSLFKIKVDAICLTRRVETYQWVENLGKGDGINKSYTYSIEWSEDWIDSTRYVKRGHVNPDNKPYPSQGFAAKTARMGKFLIDGRLCAGYNGLKPLALAQPDFDRLPDKMRMNFKLRDGYLYKGYNPQSPAIGDTRITFWYSTPEPATILARQSATTLTPAILPHGGSVMGFMKGEAPLERMYTPPAGHKAALAMMFRFFGFLAVWIGLMLVLEPLEIFIFFAPRLHGLLEKKPARSCALAALFLSLGAMAPEWLSFQPMVSGGMALAGLASLGILAMTIRSATPKPPPPPPVRPPAPEDTSEPDDGVYRPRKPAYFAPAAPGAAGVAAQGEPGEVYKPKRPPALGAVEPKLSGKDGAWPEAWAQDAKSRRIERAFVFHEIPRLDKEKATELIRQKETSPDGLPPRMGGIVGIHLSAWPQDRQKLNSTIKKGMAAWLKKHADAPRYDDRAVYEMKVWGTRDELLGRLAVVLAIRR